MQKQPYPPLYTNRTGAGQYRRKGFDRLLDRATQDDKPKPTVPKPAA